MTWQAVGTAGRAENPDEIEVEVRITAGVPRRYRVLAADVPAVLAGYSAVLFNEEGDPVGDIGPSADGVMLLGAGRAGRERHDLSFDRQPAAGRPVPRKLPRPVRRRTPEAGAVRWVFINLTSGNPIQIATTPDERDRFMRYCNREGIRGGLIRVDESGIVVEHPVNGG